MRELFKGNGKALTGELCRATSAQTAARPGNLGFAGQGLCLQRSQGGLGEGKPCQHPARALQSTEIPQELGCSLLLPTALAPGCRGTRKAWLAAEEMKTTGFRVSVPNIPPGGDSVTGRSLLPSPAPQGLPSSNLLLPPPCPHFFPAPQQSEAPSSRQPSCHVPALTRVPERHFPGVFPSGKESQMLESSQSRAGQLLCAQHCLCTDHHGHPAVTASQNSLPQPSFIFLSLIQGKFARFCSLSPVICFQTGFYAL